MKILATSLLVASTAALAAACEAAGPLQQDTDVVVATGRAGAAEDVDSESSRRVERLRTDFRIAGLARPGARLPSTRPALPQDVAVGFTASPTHRTPTFGRGVRVGADVTLPHVASGPTTVTDRASGTTAVFSLAGASAAPAALSGGLVVYAHALGDHASVVHRPTPSGTEDFVALDAPIGDLVYTLSTAGFAGLRVVANAVELVDVDGTPRVRMAPPWAATRAGRWIPLDVHVEGCAYDTDVHPPWGRAPTLPGADTCRIVVSLDERVSYPALVDPSWTTTTGQLAVARTDHATARLPDGRIWVTGGWLSGAPLDSTELYDPASDSFAMGPTLANALAHHSAIELTDGRVLVLGGGFAETQVYDGATLVAGPTLGFARDYHSSTRLADGRILLAGGYGTGASKACEVVDMSGGGSTTPTGSMLYSRADHRASLLPDGRVVATGGCYGNPVSTVETWDPVAGTWSTNASMSTQRCYHSATTLADGRVLVAGGIDPNYYSLSSAEVWVPPVGVGPGTWTPTPALNPGRQWQEAVVLPTDQVLIVGGYDPDDVVLASATLYDPVANLFAPTTAMTDDRVYFTLTPLASGGYLAVGGDSAAGVLTSAETFVAADVGEACLTGGDCANANCVDGFCCATACDGPCESCSAAEKGFGSDGSCEALAAGTMDDACPDEGAASCGTIGTCGANGACALAPEGRVCGLVACAGSSLIASRCNGLGGCAQSTTPCAPFACADAFACATTCEVTDDCAGNTYCASDGTCIPKIEQGAACTEDYQCKSGACSETGICSGTGCLDDSSLRLPDATVVDCAPFVCSLGECVVRCESVLDCVDGHVCDAEGQCVAPRTPVHIDGCAVAPGSPPRGPGRAAWLQAVAFIVALRRRGRREGPQDRRVPIRET